MNKPVLYPNYKIDSDNTILNRVDFQTIYEVYKLLSEKYLILFLDVHESFVRIMDINARTIVVGKKTFNYIIIDKYSKGEFSNKLKKIMKPTGFAAVGGMFDLKKTLLKDVIEPLRNPQKYEKFRLSVPNGILLFGPPGCGKTFIVKKLAEEIGYSFFDIKHSDLASTYIHGMVEKIRDVFKKAEESKPAIIFFDEIDGLIPVKDTLGGNQSYKQEEINEFLIQFNDAGKKNILIIGATNKPHMIDRALLRPGRMDKIIYVSAPDTAARIELFKIYMAGVPAINIDYDRLAYLTEGYASVDIEYVVKESARKAVDENKEVMTQNDFEVVIYESKSSITKEELERYSNFSNLTRK